MNIDTPQLNYSNEPEIFRLLKLGGFAAIGNEQELPKPEIYKPSNQEKAKAIYSKMSAKYKPGIRAYSGLLMYPLIFGASFTFFYTAMNFPSLAAQASGFFNTKSQEQQIVGQDLAAYTAWINGYFYAVSNKDLLAANNDIDKDGLTNYDEFVMRTNPTLSDSDSDGTSDGVEVLNSTNPWGSGKMTSSQDKLRDKLNLIMISDRISYNVSTNKGKTASTLESDNFDLTRPGQLSIPKLNLQVDLIWSKDPSEFDNDLEHGVIHYPGTALPGEQGTMYVSGHSSDYIWKHNPFAHVFTKLNYLAPGDDIFVNVYGKDGKLYNFRYRVKSTTTYKPDDQTQFIDNSAAILNLSTCWPIGTQKDRLVVTSELVGL